MHTRSELILRANGVQLCAETFGVNQPILENGQAA